MQVGRRRRPIGLLLLSLVVACSGKPESGGPAPAQLEPELARRVLSTYTRVAYAAYDESVEGARRLLTQIDALLAAPSPGTLAAARDAWLMARSSYAQTEVYRFYDGPIDGVELLVNTWPIDEGYVESEGQDGALGIVQDVARYPELSAALLTQLNGRDGETAISTGYHVIEFLLWGRDLNANGPGERSHRDFVLEQAQDEPRRAGESLAARRGAYLRIAATLLLEQLESVRAAFSEQPGNYRAQFLSAPPAAGVYRALKGMGKLSGPELSGERLTVPYETKSQENEHSCFSDSTGRDLVGNARGVENVCLGRYQRGDGRRVQGEGICALVKQQQPALGKALEAAIRESVRRVAAIPQPFDQAILGPDAAPGRTAVRAAIEALQKQAELIEQARAALGLTEPAALAVAR
ncbi:MAG TPA: imelysin family protein [Polyangiales bacterium]